MTDSKPPKNENGRNTLAAQLKGRNIGILILAVIGVVAPAWTGTINSFNQGMEVDEAKEKVGQAHEKTDYSYKLLSEKFRLERDAVLATMKQQDKRIDRLESKLDRLLMTFQGEAPPAPEPETTPEEVTKADRLELPDTLKKAMEQKSL